MNVIAILVLGVVNSCAAPTTSIATTRPAYLDAAPIQRSISITKGPWSVSGTLTLPKSGRARAGIVLVQGSGPADRDETIGPNKPFRDLAFGLAANGIATLRYDKRTHAHPILSSLTSITVENEVIEDALAAVKQLRARKEMDDVPIFLLGHSLGGMLAPEIAEREDGLAGIIMLAAPARPWEDMIVEQFTYLLQAGRAKDKEMLSHIQEHAELLRKRSMPWGRVFLGAGRSYWYDLLDRDADVAVGRAAALKCPILVLQGGRDYQVTVEDYHVWQKGLKDHADATFKLFDDHNHLFVAGEGKATADEYYLEKHIDARVIEYISDWCHSRSKQSKAKSPTSGPN